MSLLYCIKSAIFTHQTIAVLYVKYKGKLSSYATDKLCFLSGACDDLDQTNDFILLLLSTVTKDKEHSVVVKATWLYKVKGRCVRTHTCTYALTLCQ